ncbi:MAG: disulfide bond formation protein B [Acidimicrobiales bacterium]|nr:disulfide bond formation protein B [Acidimicrobiales bacterium]
MDPETVTTFFALLAVFAQSVVALVFGSWVLGRFVPVVERRREAVGALVAPQAIALAAVVALVCTLGSLYLSEVAHFRPCRLCWYQRFAMYPLVVLLAVAAATRIRLLRVGSMAVAVVGGTISIYHLAIERIPSLEASSSCDPFNPCSLIWVEHFGYVTIPAMALSGFALIVTLLVVAGGRDQEAP